MDQKAKHTKKGVKTLNTGIFHAHLADSLLNKSPKRFRNQRKLMKEVITLKFKEEMEKSFKDYPARLDEKFSPKKKKNNPLADVLDGYIGVG